MYADFNYYKGSFHGRKIPDSDSFISVAAGADAILERMTFGRLSDNTPGAADAMCAVCEVLYTRGNRDGIAAESVDGYSVSYSEEERLTPALRRAVRMYLSPQLLYRGC